MIGIEIVSGAIKVRERSKDIQSEEQIAYRCSDGRVSRQTEYGYAIPFGLGEFCC